MKSEKLKQILGEFGFTRAEIKVYVALLKLGETKVGEIIKLSSVSSSNVHECLEKLIKKGVISYILKNNIKYFYSTKPENLKLILREKRAKLDKKEQELNSIIPELINLSNKDIITQGAEIFIGFNGLKNAFKKFVDPIIENTESHFFHRTDKNTIDIIHQFYSKLELDGDYNNIKQKGIASKDYKQYIDKRKKSSVKMKYTDFPIPSSINMYSNKTLLISWSKEPIAFLITSEQITNTFENLFEEIWNLN